MNKHKSMNQPTTLTYYVPLDQPHKLWKYQHEIDEISREPINLIRSKKPQVQTEEKTLDRYFELFSSRRKSSIIGSRDVHIKENNEQWKKKC